MHIANSTTPTIIVVVFIMIIYFLVIYNVEFPPCSNSEAVLQLRGQTGIAGLTAKRSFTTVNYQKAENGKPMS